MMEIRCLLVEDELPATELLKSYIEQVPDWRLCHCSTDALDAMSYLNSNQVDVIFVDVQLPALSGLDFIQSLPNPPLIIITSAYQEHAVKAFELRVFDYLLKPYSFARFVQSVQRVQNHLSAPLAKPENSEEFIELLQNRVVQKIRISSIQFIESQREYVEVHCRKECVRSKISLTRVMTNLPADQFFQIHRSFVVSRAAIKAYTHNSVQIGETSLPVGRIYRAAFRAWVRRT